MRAAQPTHRKLWTVAAAALVGALVLTANPFLARANHQPANKLAASASSIEIMSVELLEGKVSEEHVLLEGTLKTSKPTDLAFAVTLECALWTDLTVIGNENPSRSVASVKVWVEMDGQRVAVSGDEDPAGEDFGKVVFCNRDFKMEMLNFDDEEDNHEIDTFLRTRAANSFNWLTLNAGSDIHEIVVKGQLELQVEGMGMAKAAVGKRTLLVSPERLANDAAI